jgi:dTDP-4-dehydrorhamnose reductase
MPRTLLVIGSKGQVGWELTRTLVPLGNVVGMDYPDLDLAEPDSIRCAIRTVNPTVILNAAAYTAVDKAETEGDRAMSINGIAPGVLAEEARAREALLIHYSTDYVFDGVNPGPYRETDTANPINVYGRTKLAGDRAVQAVNGRHLIFRLCWVYGARGHNFVRTMLRLATSRDELRVVNDQHGCPTWCRWIAEATTLALLRVLTDREPGRFHGLYHLAAGGKATWHEFAQAIVDRLPDSTRRCHQVIPIPTAEYPLPARRPTNSVLDCTRLQQTFQLTLPDWRIGLEQVFGEIAEAGLIADP